jgi:hypothetical protein
MRNISIRSAVLLLSLSWGLSYGQTVTIATVSSSYPVTVPASFTGTMFDTTGIGVSYPIGLAPGSYISGTQLNTDFQTFLAAYPNPQDPLEAILSTVLKAILNKYPQMTGGSIFGDIPGPGTMEFGVMIPGPSLGSVSVVIGSYNPTTGLITGLSRTGTAKPVSPAKPAPPR